MFLHSNVLKNRNAISPGSAQPKLSNVTVLFADDIVAEPVRNSGGVKMEGNYALKPGAKPILVYITPSTQAPTFEGDGDEDSVSIAHKFTGMHPGDALEINEFIQNTLGKNVILIVGNCQNAVKKVYGTRCAPMQLKPTYQGDNEKTGHTLNFEQFQKSALLPGHYEGTLPEADPHDIADVTATALTVSNGYYYQVPSLAVTAAIDVTSIDLPTGQFVTLYGGGGVAPATLSEGAGTAATVILKDGTDWTALEGASIDLEVIDGGTTTYLIERRRR